MPEKRLKTSRTVDGLTAEKFNTLFVNTESPSYDVDGLLDTFNVQCAAILDDVAPRVARFIRPVNSTPLINEETRTCRRECRKAERSWKSTNLEVHRLFPKTFYQTLMLWSQPQGLHILRT